MRKTNGLIWMIGICALLAALFAAGACAFEVGDTEGYADSEAYLTTETTLEAETEVDADAYSEPDACASEEGEQSTDGCCLGCGSKDEIQHAMCLLRCRANGGSERGCTRACCMETCGSTCCDFC